MDLADKEESNSLFDLIKTLWQGKDVLIVEGETSRSGVGNDLFDGVASLERIICPSHHAYSKIDKILQEIVKHGQNKLVLLMLGPTAKVLAHKLYLLKFQALDIGHIDSEYEWFKQGATHKIKLPHKHTAEHNFDEGIVFDHDKSYEESIVGRIY